MVVTPVEGRKWSRKFSFGVSSFVCLMHGDSDGFDILLGLVIGGFCRSWKSFTLSNIDPKQTLLPILRAFDFCGGFAFFR